MGNPRGSRGDAQRASPVDDDKLRPEAASALEGSCSPVRRPSKSVIGLPARRPAVPSSFFMSCGSVRG
jgi:hypothetical protein